MIVKRNQIIPEKVVVAGNPAKVTRRLQQNNIKLWSWGKQVYIDLAQKYLKLGIKKI